MSVITFLATNATPARESHAFTLSQASQASPV